MTKEPIKITLLRPELDAIRSGATALLFPDLPAVRAWKRGQKLVSRRTKIAMTVTSKHWGTVSNQTPQDRRALGGDSVVAAVLKKMGWSSGFQTLTLVRVKVEK